MPGRSPTSESIIFPNGIDSLPSVYDASDATVPRSYTKLWAEFYNKIRNFIGIIQPGLTANTASSDGSFEALTYHRLDNPPSLRDLMDYIQSLSSLTISEPPSNILPFEFVVTYSNYPYQVEGLDRIQNTTLRDKFVHKAPASTINGYTAGDDLPTMRPTAKVTLTMKDSRNLDNPLLSESRPSNLIVNSYVVPCASGIIIRGSIMDVTKSPGDESAIPGTSLYSFGSGNFPDEDKIFLNVTLVGIRENS